MPNSIVFSNPGASIIRWGDGVAAPYLTLSGISGSPLVGVPITGYVTNTGSAPGNWSIASSPSDVLIDPSTGTIPVGVQAAFTLTALVAGIKSISLSSSTPGATIAGSPMSFAATAPAPPPPSPSVATQATITLPATGTTGVAMAGTVSLNGAAPSSGTVTLVGSGAAFSPTSLSWTSGESGAAKGFTITRAADGNTAYSITNTMGLTNAGAGTFTSSTVLPDPNFGDSGIYVLALSPTYYTLGWPRVKHATSYDYSLDDGATWASSGTDPFAEITGRTAATTDLIRVRASNPSGSDEITGSVTLPGSGAPTWTWVTVGAGGDWATPQLAEANRPLNLVGLNQCYQMRLLSGAEFATVNELAAGLDVIGATTDATRYMEITAAPGHSFADHEDRMTNPLRYNPAVGAALKHSPNPSVQSSIDIREGFGRITRMQVASTTGYAVHTSTATTTCRFDQCILESAGVNYVLSPNGPHIATRCVIINTRATGAGIIAEFSLSGKLYDCTLVSVRSRGTFALASPGANGQIYNSAAFNVAGFVATAGVAPSGNPAAGGNYSDMDTTPSGFAPLVFSSSTGAGFESITWPNHDLRVSGTSGLRTGAVSAAEMPALDILNNKRPDDVSLRTVGAYQVPVVTSEGAAVSLTTLNVDTSRMITFRDYLDGTPYERFQDPTVYTGSSATVLFRGWHPTASGGNRALLAGTYRLLVDDVERATVSVTAGVTLSSSFTLDLAPFAEGWHWMKIEPVGSVTGETCPPWPFYRRIGSAGVSQSTMPITTASFSVMSEKQPYRYGMVPQTFDPILVPFPSRSYPEAATAYTRAQMVEKHIVPWRRQDTYRPQGNGGGVTHTFNHQFYFWDSMRALYPGNLASIDGPRGRAVVGMVTHLQIGRNGKIYFLTPWSFGRIDVDGTVTTLAGWRHKVPFASTPGNPLGDLDLIGDWSAIPTERHGFHEAWAHAWDARTLTTDPGAPPVGGEQPHVVGPVVFISDTQNNRIIKLQFNATVRDAPAIVTEFITGLQDPWSVVCTGSSLFITERKLHRIVEHSADTGAYIRTLISGTAVSALDQNRVAKLNVGQTLANAQAQPCQLPEGLYLHDGWLYWGALIQRQVRRINLTTEVAEVVATPNVDSNSKFFQIAVSDGTFYPAGTVFTCNWGVFNYGRPQGLNVGVNSAGYGAGTPWETIGYPSAVAVGQGRLVYGSSSEGVTVVSAKLVTDSNISQAQWSAWFGAWRAGGYQQTHGHQGWGYYGLAQPWGVSADIDNFLTACGHTI
jgi:hypothetical protein